MTRRPFLVWWVLGHAAVGAILAGASLPLTGETLASLTDTPAVGALAALVQWLVLRAVVGLSAWWVPASLLVGGLLGMPLFIAGMLAGMGLFFSPLSSPLRPLLSFVPFPISLGVAGAVLGALQARMLRRHAPSTRPWVVAQTLGLAVQGPLAFYARAEITSLLDPGVRVDRDLGPFIPGAILGGVLGGLVYGAATGAVMARLVRAHLRPSRP